MWVLDISGQHLGAGCVVGVSVRPSGTLLGNINLLKYKFVLNTTIWGIYAENNFESIYVSLIFMLVLDTHHLEWLLECSGVGNIHL